jgi:hypothetical protein
MNGGWQTFTEASGQPFPNQGLCIAYAIQHPVSLADLQGSFTGTWGFQFPPNGCPTPPFGSANLLTGFSTRYAGSPAVGLVTLDIAGCVLITRFGTPVSFSNGMFTISTNVGTLAGSASGGISSSAVGLTLGVTSGTGLFSGIVGNLGVSIQLVSLGFMTGSLT